MLLGFYSIYRLLSFAGNEGCHEERNDSFIYVMQRIPRYRRVKFNRNELFAGLHDDVR